MMDAHRSPDTTPFPRVARLFVVLVHCQSAANENPALVTSSRGRACVCVTVYTTVCSRTPARQHACSTVCVIPSPPLHRTRLISLRRLFFPAIPILPSLPRRRLLHDSRSRGFPWLSYFFFFFRLLVRNVCGREGNLVFASFLRRHFFLSLLSCSDFTGRATVK